MADVAEKQIEKDSVETEAPAAKEVEAAEPAAAAGEEKSSNGTAEKEEHEGNAQAANKKELTGKELENSIIRQVEYYFGDANLHRDKFLNEQIGKDENGWVPLTVLLTFKRLAALSSDADVIVDALSKSEEGLLEISEDRTKIRRHPERPLPEHNEERRKEIMTRTAYVKGFPLDAQIEDVLEFFEPYQKIANVTMRKYYDKSDKTYKFKGSVFVTFEKKEQTQDFIEKEGLTCKEKPLVRKWQEEYLNEKREERTKQKNKKEKKPKPEEKELVLPTGTVLHFEGIDDEETKREDIRDAVEKADPDSAVAYIEFNKGQKDGKIRFQNEGQAAKFLEKLAAAKLTIKEGIEISLRTLSQDEEEEFLKTVVMNMKNLRNRGRFDKGNYRKRRGGGGGGNFNNRKNKKQKFDGSDDE